MKLVKNGKVTSLSTVKEVHFPSPRKLLFYAQVFYELPWPGLIVSLSSDNTIVDSNSLANKELNTGSLDLIERPFFEIFDPGQGMVLENLSYSKSESALSTSSLPKSQKRLRTADARQIFDLVYANSFSSDGSDYLIILFRRSGSVSENSNGNGQNFMADSLPGLPDTALVEGKLDLLCNNISLNARDLAVAIFSLEDWRQIESSHSAWLSKELIRAISTRLHRWHCDNVFISRYKKDEFLILLHGRSDYREILEEIHSALQDEFVINGLSFQFTINAGVGVRNIWEAPLAEEMLAKARKAVERSRLEGEGRLVTFSDKMELRTQSRHAIDEIIDGFHKGEFSLNLQPVINLKKGTVELAEGLLRWDHPQKGTQLPVDFLESIQNLSMYNEVSLCVLDLSLRILDRWHKCNIPTKLCINISADQLADETFLTGALVVISNYSQDVVSQLSIDILQQSQQGDSDKLIFSLDSLARKGLGFALDDFGVGDSALLTSALPFISSIKLSQHYVKGMDEDLGSVYIVQQIVEFASQNDINVYAKGVETTNQYNILKALGCKGAQGFWLAEPLTEERFMDYLRNFSLECRPVRQDRKPSTLPNSFTFALAEHKLLLREMLIQTIVNKQNLQEWRGTLVSLLTSVGHLERREPKRFENECELISIKTRARQLLDTSPSSIKSVDHKDISVMRQEIRLLSELITNIDEIICEPVNQIE